MPEIGQLALVHVRSLLSLLDFKVTISKDGKSSFEFYKKTAKNMYLLTEWEGRTGKYLARGHGVRTERSEVRAP